MRRFAPLLVTLLLLAGGRAALPLDGARGVMGVDKARAEFGVTGHRVVVGIIDRGIDPAHPGLRHEDGRTRILAMLDLTDDAGAQAAGNPYGVGTIYRQADIDKALAAGTALPTRDEEGRGTASAGIACGNGRGSKEGRLRGIAPRAQMLVVKLKADPSPWQGAPGEPPVAVADEAKDAWFDLKRLRTALEFCVAEAKAVARPLVMLMNFGEVGGPTDASSKLCRTIDELTGPGTAGRVLITGSSDKGDRKNRAAGRVPANGLLTLPVQKESYGEVRVDIWYGASDRLDVSVHTPEKSFGPFPAPRTGKSEYGPGFQLYHLSSSRNQVLTLGGKRQIRVDLVGPPGRYAVTLHGTKVQSGSFDAFIGPNPENPMDEPFNKFLEHAAPGSLWDGASANQAIVVGCFILRSDWTNIDGRDLYQLGEGKPGQIWLGSGTGPTADGRPGVTLCAPGDRIATTYARGSEWADVRRNLISDDGGLYGLSSGTTAAAALVAGVAALMLEADPSLSGADVKTILRETARRDEHTGRTPNPTWGHGKIDAYAAIARVVAGKR